VANVNRPFGLQPTRGSGSYKFNAQGTLYRVPSTDTTNAYYLGDPVKAAAGADANGVSNVVIAAGTDTLRGVITGIMPVYPGVSIQGVPLTLETMNIPATKTHDYYVIVEDDPTAEFAVQDDGITTSKLVAASANLNFSLTITAGATTSSVSATVMLSSSLATTNTLNMKARGLLQVPGASFTQYAIWNCRINEHELTGNYAGV
jgi:hypothetical protein